MTLEQENKREDLTGWRATCHEIIYEADTPAGRLFDLILIGCILCSILAIMLESVDEVGAKYGTLLRNLEWFFTILFTIEYILRLSCVLKPSKYALSFFGLVDLLAVAPTYLSLLAPDTRFFVVIRVLRVLRVFRILKLARYLRETTVLMRALRASRIKILVFMYTVLTLVVMIGSLMYVVEGAENGFTSIPRSVYWAIVTLTTVGYGDISPQTDLGQTLAAFVMIIGYAIIAVPTGIVTSEITRASHQNISSQACPSCSLEGHDADAKHCKFCGSSL